MQVTSDSSPPPGLPQRSDLWQLLRGLYAHKWLIAATVILGAVAAYLMTERQPRIYEADCTIEYDPNPVRPLGRDIDDVATPMYYWSTREYFATQNQIISSRAVAERVVRQLGLHQNPDFMGVPPEQRKGWKGGDVVQAARMLQGSISVAQERDNRIVHIRVRGRDPERATILANAVADAYIQKTLEDRLGSASGALDWLGKQLDSLKGQLEKSELALHDFVSEQANLSVPFAEQQTLVTADIQRYSQRLAEVKLERLELTARLEALRAADSDNPLAFRHAELSQNPTVVELRSQYFELEAERSALASKYGDKHPAIASLDAKLADLRKQLRSELDTLIAAAEARLQEVQDIEDSVQGLLSRANAQGLALNLQEITYRRLQRERDNADRLYGTLLERTAEADLSRALEVSYVRVVDRAIPPTFSVYPSYRKNITVGILIGLLFGVAIAVLLTQLDRVIRTVEDAEALGLTVLGVLPKIEDGAPIAGVAYGRRRRRNAPELMGNRDLIVHTHPKSPVAECCRTIRTNLTFMSADHPLRSVVVTSASPREGKTTVTLSLAISLAQSGKRVLVVDTDLRKPRIHKALSRKATRGMTTIMVGEHTLDEAVQDTEIPGLDLLASGPIPPNPSELLHTPKFRELLQEATERYDHVVLDSPPLAAVTDAAIIAPQVDGAIVVVHGQKTTRDAIRSALRQLRDVSAHLIGGVLNDVDLSARHYGYGAYYYYNSEAYYGDAEDETREREVPAAES